MNPLLDIMGLEAGYGDIQVLWDVNMSIQAGEIISLIGSNGAGKTTLLRCLSGLIPARGGHIKQEGAALNHRSSAQRVAHGLAHVPEGRHLFASLSVQDNLLLGAYSRQDGPQAISRTMNEVYELFPRLAERRHQDASTLSGGEQQMCAVGRGLMAAPKLLMIDELSLGLAPMVVDELVLALKQVNQQGTSLLIVEQDVAIALELAHRAYVLDQGRTTISGEAATLAKDPAIRSAYLGVA